MEIAYFIRLLKRKWLILFISSVLASGLTFFLLTIKPKEYYSRAQISAGITDNNQISYEKTSLNWNDIGDKFNNFLEFLNSNQIYYLVGYKMLLLDLNENGAYKNAEYQELLTKFTAKQISESKARILQKYNEMIPLDLSDKDDIQIYNMLKTMYHEPENMKKVIQVSRIAGSDYIKVEAKTINPKLSSALVNTYCEEAIRLNHEKEIKNAEKSVMFFKELMLSKKEDFQAKLDSLTKMKSGKQVIDFSTQSQAQIEKISVLEQSRNDGQQKINGLRKAIASIDNQLNESSRNSYKKNHTNRSILALKTKIEQLNERNINSGFSNKAISDSIELLKRQVDIEIDAASNSLYGDTKENYKNLLAQKMEYEIELSMLEASISTLDKNIHSNKSSLTQFVGDEATLTPLEMSLNVAKEEYTKVVDKYNEAMNEAMKNGALVRQIEVGQPAYEPEPAKRVFFSGLAAIGTLAIGMTVLFLITYFDSTIRDPQNFARNVGLPLIGFVYKVKSKSDNVDKIFFDPTNKEPNDVKFKEQLRSIRYEIEKSQNKVFMFTSTASSEGKSFFIISLAYSMILNFKKVLIIDTNFKNNTLSMIYDNKSNFEDYFFQPGRKLLSDGNTVYSLEAPSNSEESNHENIIQKTRIEGLDMISCKGNDLSPSEIFHGKRFHELLDSLRERYDYIFLEGSNLNLYSDSKELSEYCDKVVGIYSADKVIAQIDRESIKYLKSLGDKYLGSILNKVEFEDLVA